MNHVDADTVHIRANDIIAHAIAHRTTLRLLAAPDVQTVDVECSSTTYNAYRRVCRLFKLLPENEQQLIGNASAFYFATHKRVMKSIDDIAYRRIDHRNWLVQQRNDLW